MREKPGTEFVVEADLVLLAMGFSGPGRNQIVEDLKIRTEPSGTIWRDGRNMTSMPGVFVAGDMSMGASLVVRAITDGRNAAVGVAAYLEDQRRQIKE
jgi:glutamate synthase (NADPH/NADH) small chain